MNNRERATRAIERARACYTLCHTAQEDTVVYVLAVAEAGQAPALSAQEITRQSHGLLSYPTTCQALMALIKRGIVEECLFLSYPTGTYRLPDALPPAGPS